MIGTIRKHSSWLWVIIIIATIASFVVYYGGPGGRGGGGRGGAGNFGSINGEPISQTEYLNARRETALRFFVSNGDWPDRVGRQMGFDWERETYFRLFLVHKLADFHISVDDEMVGNQARDILRSLNRGQSVPLAAFEQQVLRPQGMTVDDFERTLRHDLGIRQLYLLIGGSGALLTPEEARMLYVRENEQVSAQAVFFSSSNYVNGVTTAPETIAQFYTNQLAYYRIPERIQISYVEFPLTNYWATAAQKMTNIDEEFDLFLTKYGLNYFPGVTNAADAKVKYVQTVHEEQARSLAKRDADVFTEELLDLKPVNPGNLNKLAEQKGLTVQVTGPFDQKLGTTNLPLHLTQMAFRLTPEEPFSSAPGEKAVYIFALDKQLPSEVPSLESIHDRVIEDYTHVQAMTLARQSTVAFFSTVTNAIASGKTFSEACASANVEPISLPPFALSTKELPAVESRMEFGALKQAAFSVLPGHANYAGTVDGGMVLFVNSRLPVNEALMNSNMAEFVTRVRQSREQEAFNLWFSNEIQQDFGMRAVLEQLAKRDQRGTPPALQ